MIGRYSVGRIQFGVQSSAVQFAATLLFVHERELSSTNIGCHGDGVYVKNMSYADAMVFLCPSTGALRKELHVYAVAQGDQIQFAEE